MVIVEMAVKIGRGRSDAMNKFLNSLVIVLCLGCASCVDCRGESPSADAGAGNDDSDTDAEMITDGDVEEASLLATPVIHSPTATSVVITAAAGSRRDRLRLEVRPEGSESNWTSTVGELLGEDVVEWSVRGLEPSTSYSYRIHDGNDALHLGRFVTQRRPGEQFTFALISDTHVFVDNPESVAGVLGPVSAAIEQDQPDFVIHLGDLLDYHAFGFNDPPPSSTWARSGYLSYRDLTGNLLATTSHFMVIGNWDGENGSHSEEEIERSRSQRLLYLPNPGPDIYPEGGSPHGDYYAFTWGDALFVVLNVMSYTLEPHLLTATPELAESWTLGEAQLEWLEQTLRTATSRWRFLCIHHPVGGLGGDESNSAYGRGGGRAARVGEQSIVHDLMLSHGVQIMFYGHDHVFTDMVVDGVHYTLPGSAGAPWLFTTTETGYGTYWPESGYGRVRVEEERVAVELVSMEDIVLHQFTIE